MNEEKVRIKTAKYAALTVILSLFLTALTSTDWLTRTQYSLLILPAIVFFMMIVVGGELQDLAWVVGRH